MLKIVGISEMAVSNNPDDIIITYSLGSCVGVAIYDPVVRLGGMVHCMLPLSRIDTGKARETPCMFTDTGVPRLLQQMFSFGAKRSNMIVKIAGASSLFDERGMFKIGERNYIVLRKVLDKNNLLVAAEDVKGCTSRTLSLFVKNGRTIVKKNGREEELN